MTSFVSLNKPFSAASTWVAWLAMVVGVSLLVAVWLDVRPVLAAKDALQAWSTSEGQQRTSAFQQQLARVEPCEHSPGSPERHSESTAQAIYDRDCVVGVLPAMSDPLAISMALTKLWSANDSVPLSESQRVAALGAIGRARSALLLDDRFDLLHQDLHLAVDRSVLQRVIPTRAQNEHFESLRLGTSRRLSHLETKALFPEVANTQQIIEGFLSAAGTRPIKVEALQLDAAACQKRLSAATGLPSRVASINGRQVVALPLGGAASVKACYQEVNSVRILAL